MSQVGIWLLASRPVVAITEPVIEPTEQTLTKFFFSVRPGGCAHDEAVTCLDVNEDNTVLASGSEDGILKLTHIGNGKVNSHVDRVVCNL